jgi:pimeloyl-ACP methyl ester carboxylesterase
VPELTYKTDRYEYKYYKYGSGPKNVIFLHGININKEIPYSLHGYFENKFTCYALDLPGHNGVSMDGINSFKDISSYLRVFVQQFIETNYYIVGFSLGGLIALDYANRYSKDSKLRGVVLWSSPVMGIQHGITGISKLFLNYFKYIPSKIHNFAVDKDLHKVINRLFGLNITTLEMKTTKDYKPKSFTKWLKLIDTFEFKVDNKINTLMIFGYKDRVVDESNYYAACEKINEKTKVCRIDYGGHYGTKEGTQASIQEIQTFLEYTN